MDIIQKELQSRRAEIRKAVDLLFKANMKITDWDVPEADDNEAAKMLLQIVQEVLDEIKEDIEAGKYDYY
ncbi:MAG: hypothetical protein U9Q62_11430 [Campylobacterota bacterium]|nr:hypothetical protein [Campylobacterota bacterium]